MSPVHSTVTHDDVVAAAARTYELSGETAMQFQKLDGCQPALLIDIVVPRLLRFEQVETAETLADFDPVPLRSYREAGVEVWVLVPLPSVGAAHTALRGAVDRIQPWWVEDGRIRFGGPQVP